MVSSSLSFISNALLTLLFDKLPLLKLQQKLVQLRQHSSSPSTASLPCSERPPPTWPSSLIVEQRRIPDADSRFSPATIITYYDSEAGGNLIQITPDNTTEPVLWDLELNNHHSYYFEPSTLKCRPMDFPVGILRQDWLAGAQSLGEVIVTDLDGVDRTTCGWTKVDFIDYYADKETGDPISWYFHTMKATFPVIHYETNPRIDPSLYVPPEYCFES